LMKEGNMLYCVIKDKRYAKFEDEFSFKVGRM
jgi:hypothetical protein